MRTVILYVFHEITPMVLFFDKHTFKKEGYDFIYVVNDVTITNEELAKLNMSNITKVIKRKNIGNDFGAWSDAVLELDLQDKYDNIIFLNSSVYGPVVNVTNDSNWCDIMLNGLSDEVKLFGSTINGAYNFHVQSYAFCMTTETLKYLIEKGIFKKGLNPSKDDLIKNYELRMSKLILDKGWNIGCLIGYTRGIDFRKEELKKRITYNYHPKYPDVQHRCFLHNLLKPKEVLFVKGNRNMSLHDIILDFD